jgi:hypothetical protein
MDLNVNWGVLALRDKSTYPTVKNRLIHFYLTDCCSTHKHILGFFTDNGFMDTTGSPIFFTDIYGDQLETCFWQYVDTLPNFVKKQKCKKCGMSEEEYWSNRCEYADDGYCLAKFGSNKCKHIRYITEYWAYNEK